MREYLVLFCHVLSQDTEKKKNSLFLHVNKNKDFLSALSHPLTHAACKKRNHSSCSSHFADSRLSDRTSIKQHDSSRCCCGDCDCVNTAV
jgi:hypothetical protein